MSETLGNWFASLSDGKRGQYVYILGGIYRFFRKPRFLIYLGYLSLVQIILPFRQILTSGTTIDEKAYI